METSPTRKRARPTALMVHLPVEMVEAIRRQAAEEDRTISTVVRRALAGVYGDDQ